ncbi:hypothetical protein [Stenotrophomonas sp. CFBP 13725]|uniref:hypothetical protein n=1 Tax=Stenotrophomonas sp. CFBP 13725 TaxID=2775297 RepID=UPI001784A5C6|nr:hypothetical protein [Stenotrophomonas sp. CFBP 13725]MBD8635231.1 hypothetical protein [Stenotrophomonas sp. CFBP 13725]
MFATLSRAKDFDQLVSRFSGPTRIGDVSAQPRRRKLRSVAMRNLHRPPVEAPQRRVERSAARPAETAPLACKAKDAVQFPATGIYAAHPMLRRIANLEARLTRAAWAEAEQTDKEISVASGFRYRPSAPANAVSPASSRTPTLLDTESDRAMEIAVQIHEQRMARGQPVYPDRTWYREGLVRRALEQV